MATYLLVHGGFQGGWAYRRVARLLRGAGHEVYTPTLTALGERSHLAYVQVNLDTHVADIGNVILWEDLEDVILVGHSYGGIVVTGVADRMPEKIASLIYLNAGLPANGKCMMDTINAERRAAVQKLADDEGDGYMVSSKLVLDTGIEDETTNKLFLSRTSAHPYPSLLQPIHLTGKYKDVKKKAYVLATKKISHHFKEYHEWAKQQPDWTAHELPTHHYPMVTAPDLTADLLMKITG